MRLLPFLLLPLAFAFVQTQQTTGFKIVTRTTFGAGSNGTTAYYLPDRSRTENQTSEGYDARGGSVQTIYGPHTATIRRCDLGKMFFLNLDTHEYSESPDAGVRLTKALAAARKALKTAAPRPPSKPTLRIETTTTDTGERKQIFGYTARRVIVTTKYIPLGGSRAIARESTNDGWYIDLDITLSCDPQYPPGTRGHVVPATPSEKVEFVDNESGKLGFPVSSVSSSSSSATSTQSPSEQSRRKFEIQVVQLQRAPLDPALFEIPPGFKLVDHINPNPIRPAPPTRTQVLWQRLKSWLSAKF